MGVSYVRPHGRLHVGSNVEYDRSRRGKAHSVGVISLTRSLHASLSRDEAGSGLLAGGLQKGDGRVYQQKGGVAMQYLRLLQSNVRDNPPQAALVAKLTAELERRGEQLDRKSVV